MLTEARRAAELATLVTKLGGVPYSAPAVREIPCRDRGPALEALERICGGEVAVVIFTTGVGTRAFLDLAAERERRAELLRALGATVVVARGPKPAGVLRDAGGRIDVAPAEPTSEGVLAALASRELAGASVAVQRYGAEASVLEHGLAARGATVLPIPLYEWAPPDDDTVLDRLVDDLTAGRVDVIAFTSSPQVEHVLATAERRGVRDRLVHALNERVPVAAVGPVCAERLRAHGIRVVIQPGKGTMGALVHSIAEYLGRIADPALGRIADPTLGRIADPALGRIADPALGRIADPALGRGPR